MSILETHYHINIANAIYLNVLLIKTIITKVIINLEYSSLEDSALGDDSIAYTDGAILWENCFNWTYSYFYFSTSTNLRDKVLTW